MIASGLGLIAVAAAVAILGKAISSMGGMSMEEIGRGLLALGGALLILTVAMHAMSGAIVGAAALVADRSAAEEVRRVVVCPGSPTEPRRGSRPSVLVLCLAQGRVVSHEFIEV